MTNSIEVQYLNLLQDILDNGVVKGDRTGTGTISVFGRQIRHNMSLGFPLLTTKEINFQNIKTELAWFLEGSSDIRFLWKNKCYIWDGDWYKNYLKNCINIKPLPLKELRKIGIDSLINNDLDNVPIYSLGPIYGVQWKWWHNDDIKSHARSYVDQIETLLYDLEHNPDSRRIMVNAWNVGKLGEMTLPPCHYGFQVYTRELSLDERKQIFEDRGYVCDVWPFNGDWHGEYDGFGIPKRAISLMWNQRSVDTPLGLPYNISSYGLLLEMLADEFNMVPGELIGNLGDTHIYLNQVEGVKEQLQRLPRKLPKLKIQDGMKSYLLPGSNDIVLEGYDPYPNIIYPLSN